MRKRIPAILLVMLLGGAPLLGQEVTPSYRIGGYYTLGNIFNDQRPHFSFNHGWGVTAGIGGRLTLSATVGVQRNYGDDILSGNWAVLSSKNRALWQFRSTRAGFDLDYRLRENGVFRPMVGIGAMPGDQVAHHFGVLAPGGDRPERRLGDLELERQIGAVARVLGYRAGSGDAPRTPSPGSRSPVSGRRGATPATRFSAAQTRSTSLIAIEAK